MNVFGPGYRTTTTPFMVAAGSFDDILWHCDRPIAGSPDLSPYGSFYQDEVDRRFDEDEEVFVHARDPFRRVDCLPRSSRVVAGHNGHIVAEASRPADGRHRHVPFEVKRDPHAPTRARRSIAICMVATIS